MKIKERDKNIENKNKELLQNAMKPYGEIKFENYIFHVKVLFDDTFLFLKLDEVYSSKRLKEDVNYLLEHSSKPYTLFQKVISSVSDIFKRNLKKENVELSEQLEELNRINSKLKDELKIKERKISSLEDKLFYARKDAHINIHTAHDVIELMKLSNFQLVGSRNIGMNKLHSDYDYMTTDKEVFSKFCKYADENNVEISYKDTDRISASDYEYYHRVYPHLVHDVDIEFNEKQHIKIENVEFDICLVTEILSKDEQIKLHNQKYKNIL